MGIEGNMPLSRNNFHVKANKINEMTETGAITDSVSLTLLHIAKETLSNFSVTDAPYTEHRMHLRLP